MIESNVASHLFELTQLIRDKNDDFKNFEKEEVVRRNELYAKTKGSITNYDKGTTASSWTTEYIVEEKILWINLEKYVERKSEKYAIISETIKAISNQFKLEEQAAIRQVGGYISYVLFEEEPDLSNGRISEIVSIFVEDLNNIPPDWKVELWVNGIWLDTNLVTINPDLTIRRPQNSDFEFTTPASFFLNNITLTSIESCDAIIEFSISRINQIDLNEHIDKLINAMRLYQLGAIQIVKRNYEPNSITTTLMMPGSAERKISSHKYQLKTSDEKNINDFLNIVMPFLPERNWQSQENVNNPIYISIERYIEALTKGQSVESKITNIITCLEALFLKSYERSELSHKLSQRVAYLMSNPIKTYKTLKRAYDVRSTYIHGSMLNEDEKRGLKDISDSTIEIARKSILFFIELSSKKNKEEILAKIDNAILDESASNKLKETIKKLEFIQLGVISE
jgi:hypothetical protein